MGSLYRAEQLFCVNDWDGSKLFCIPALLCLVMPLYWSHAESNDKYHKIK